MCKSSHYFGIWRIARQDFLHFTFFFIHFSYICKKLKGSEPNFSLTNKHSGYIDGGCHGSLGVVFLLAADRRDSIVGHGALRTHRYGGGEVGAHRVRIYRGWPPDGSPRSVDSGEKHPVDRYHRGERGGGDVWLCEVCSRFLWSQPSCCLATRQCRCVYRGDGQKASKIQSSG